MTEFELICYHVKRDKLRFISRLQRNVEAVDNGCVFWTGAYNNNGYAKINLREPGGKHRQLYVHRVFAILASGEPIPDGFEVDHECRNRMCVRCLKVIPVKLNRQLVHKRNKRA